MALLDMMQNVCNELGLSQPTAVIGTSDVTLRQLVALAHRAIRDARSRVMWPKLMREYTFTLVASQANYAFPADYDRQVFRTNWNRDRKWELYGPITPQEWQYRKSGIVSSTPWQRFRISGWQDNQFYIQPTPTASEAGQTIAFEYLNTTAIAPKMWTTATTFVAGSYCSYNGNIYKTTLGGVTGATPPTHTSSSASDGAVSWTYQTAGYTTYLADTDYCLIDEFVIGLSIQWRWMQQKGLQYEKIEAEYEKALMREISAEVGAPTLTMANKTSTFLISARNIPDTGYGS